MAFLYAIRQAAALSEYARLTGIPPYAAMALLVPPQQQSLRPSVIAHSVAPQVNTAESFRVKLLILRQMLSV